jgi:hypothetical protein
MQRRIVIVIYEGFALASGVRVDPLRHGSFDTVARLGHPAQGGDGVEAGLGVDGRVGHDGPQRQTLAAPTPPRR